MILNLILTYLEGGDKQRSSGHKVFTSACIGDCLCKKASQGKTDVLHWKKSEMRKWWKKNEKMGRPRCRRNKVSYMIEYFFLEMELVKI